MSAGHQSVLLKRQSSLCPLSPFARTDNTEACGSAAGGPSTDDITRLRREKFHGCLQDAYQADTVGD